MPTEDERSHPETTPSTTPSSPVALSTTPPVLSIPTPPVGSTDIPLGIYRGYHPQPAEIAALSDAIAELSSSTTFRSAIGPGAPTQEVFLKSLENAAGWISIRMQLEAYLTYVKVQEGEAWKVATGTIDAARKAFDVVSAKNPSLPTDFPALARLFAARVQRGQKGASTRKRNRDEKAKEAAAAVTASTSSPHGDEPR